jgi:monoamine oxidase
MIEASLQGSSVIVAGAGLAGLTAAHELHRRGADVTVLEARRDRIGGRVWTRRDFEARQSAEAGGDLIDGAQTELLNLAHEVGCQPVRILRGGFAYYASSSRKLVSGARGWERLADALAPHIRAYRLAEGRWHGGVARELSRRSVADWLEEEVRDEELQRIAVGLRGFFLADPQDLSLLALVDQFAGEDPASARMFRLRGGNDTLVQALADRLGDRIRLATTVVAVSHGASRVQVRVRDRRGALGDLTADYLVMALPATTLRDVVIDPPLPDRQREAIATLSYGAATRVLAQFDRRFWRAPGRTRAAGTDLPIGAVWEGNEEQPGSAGILTFLAGGRASGQLHGIFAAEGARGLLRRLEWMNTDRVTSLTAHVVTWESDPWAQGGYAVFKPTYDPELRGWLARPHGRTVFAGEHTSYRWQGYMNGAVESGIRAALEIVYARRQAGSPTWCSSPDQVSGSCEINVEKYSSTSS